MSEELAKYDELPQGVVQQAHLGDAKVRQFKEPVRSDDDVDDVVEEEEEKEESMSSEEERSNRTNDYKV